MRPEAILFDWDNTLVDTWSAIHEALNATLVAFGHAPWTLHETRDRVRKSMRDSFPALFGDAWRDAGETFYRHLDAVHLDTLAPRPGARRMLDELSDAGFYLGVVSNKKGEVLRVEAAHLGWERYFAKIVGAFDAARDKPAPDPVDMALFGSGIERGDKVWFAGDTDVDLACAFNSGCVGVLVRRKPPAETEFGATRPTWHFPDCLTLSKTARNL
ncbi:MAG TPA: HAD hydrolase-like protein [Rhodospirillales bacterium]|nr:HAD hydrolase-like protein [Rhodospirillales bacterium]